MCAERTPHNKKQPQIPFFSLSLPEALHFFAFLQSTRKYLQVLVSISPKQNPETFIFRCFFESLGGGQANRAVLSSFRICLSSSIHPSSLSRIPQSPEMSLATGFAEQRISIVRFSAFLYFSSHFHDESAFLAVPQNCCTGCLEPSPFV